MEVAIDSRIADILTSNTFSEDYPPGITSAADLEGLVEDLLYVSTRARVSSADLLTLLR